MKYLIVLAVIILVTIIVVVMADHFFYKNFVDRAAEIKAEVGRFDSGKITEEDLKLLPEPVAKYIRYVGLIGKERINSMHVIHSGSFRPATDKKFMPIEGEYYLTTKKPSFVWFGKITMIPFITTSAFDSYYDGKGRMTVKMLSVVNIADVVSDETNLSSLGRCFAEMAMAPSFYLDNTRIVWTDSDAFTATCMFTDNNQSTKARLFFNKDYSLDKIVVNRFYENPNGRPTLEKFTGKCTQYKNFEGLNLATVYDGYWNLRSGDFHYVHFTVDKISFD